jgi:hypothetical protein
MSVSAAAIPELTETNWVAWNVLQAARMRQLSVWSVITEEHTAPALELLQAGTNEDGTLIPLTTDQKALNIRIKLDNNAAAERFRSAREKAAGNIYVHLLLIQGYLCDIGLSLMYICSDVFHGLVVSRVVSVSSCTKCHVALIM